MENQNKRDVGHFVLTGYVEVIVIIMLEDFAIIKHFCDEIRGPEPRYYLFVYFELSLFWVPSSRPLFYF